METQAWITLALLIIMFALLVWGKLPTWLVFMGTLTVMMTLKLAPADDLLKGFSNSGVITVGVLFVVAAGMYSTGAITLISDILIGLPKSLYAAQLKILPSAAVGSAFLNNTPLVAMMIPVVRDISRATRMAASLMLMPLSYASILGGATTLIGTSTNLILAGLVMQQLSTDRIPPGMEELSIFTPTPIAAPAAIIGIGFIILVGARLLPRPKEETILVAEKRLYQAVFIVEPNTNLVGKLVKDSGLFKTDGFELTSLEREGAPIPELQIEPQSEVKPNIFQRSLSLFRRPKKEKPQPEPLSEFDLGIHIIRAGDILTYATTADALPDLWTTIGLRPYIQPLELETKRYHHSLVEAVIGYKHPAVGRKVSELPVRERPPYRAAIVAYSHYNQPPEIPLQDIVIKPGDNVIMEVEDNFFYETRSEIEYSLTQRLPGYQIRRTSRALVASLITLSMVLLTAFQVTSMLNAALLAALVLLLTGCLDIRAAWRSIEWDMLVVLAAAIGMEAAVSNSGLSQTIADVIMTISGSSAYIALTVVFFSTVVMTNVITNAAAAAFMFPIAVAISLQLNANFAPFIIIVMLGTSYAFINPAGYQTNLMVQAPGGYRFGDYARLGLPLTLVVGVIAILMSILIYGF